MPRAVWWALLLVGCSSCHRMLPFGPAANDARTADQPAPRDLPAVVDRTVDNTASVDKVTADRGVTADQGVTDKAVTIDKEVTVDRGTIEKAMLIDKPATPPDTTGGGPCAATVIHDANFSGWTLTNPVGSAWESGGVLNWASGAGGVFLLQLQKTVPSPCQLQVWLDASLADYWLTVSFYDKPCGTVAGCGAAQASVTFHAGSTGPLAVIGPPTPWTFKTIGISRAPFTGSSKTTASHLKLTITN